MEEIDWILGGRVGVMFCLDEVSGGEESLFYFWDSFIYRRSNERAWEFQRSIWQGMRVWQLVMFLLFVGSV